MCILDWLVPSKKWLIHPMYFTKSNEKRDETFPCRYADFLGVRLLNAVADNAGHLFLDPDTGLRLDTGLPLHRAMWRKYVNAEEFIEIAHDAEQKLVLVYDRSINFDHQKDGNRRQQVRRKLCHLRKAKARAVAYVSHISFIWASTDPKVVCAATQQLLLKSGLPDCCFVDEGCGHLPHL